ncbi:MAG TPA: hypothetical protein PKK00_12430 [Bacteroidales bacterium]|nr:hypothetical protein [Bacteroidales bacterium]HPS18035.1 hypothetical protein [Bacteroidales bacterium]
MKKIICYLPLFFIYTLSFPQNINYIENYYKPILKAELFLIECKPDSSLYYYQKAFSNVPYAFASDFKNAAYAEYLLNNKALARNYIDSASIRGMPLNKRLKKYFNNKTDWTYYNTIKYTELKKKNKIKRDSSMIKLVDSLYLIDQNIRIRTKKFDLVWQKKCVETDSLNYLYLRPYLTNGKIGEESLGWETYIKLSIITYHYMLDKDKELIKRLYIEGKLNRTDFFYCITRPTQWGEKTEFLYPEMLKKNYKNINLDEINDNRIEYAIPNVEQTIKLKKLQKKSNGLFFFTLKWY